jgi:hypothetical protein
MSRPGSEWVRSAAIVQRPSVPAPMTATVSPVTPGAIAAWIAHAVGSTITAASSLIPSGTWCSWLSWATSAVLQPPPVSVQKPVCNPGCRWPNARRSHRSVAPSAQASHGGSMPRAAHASTGSTTTRVPSSRSPTIS